MIKKTVAAKAGAAKTKKLAFQLKGPSHPEFLKEEVLADIFRASAKAHPKAIAMIDGERRISYAEADTSA